MPRLIVRQAEGGAEQLVELDEGSAVLLGRAPDPGAVVTPDPLTVRPVPVQAPSVSANHALAWLEGQMTCVQDLGSRNGTWLRLPRGQILRIPNAGDVILQLAQPSKSGEFAEEPPTPTWSGRNDFAESLASTLRIWVRQQNFEARVTFVAEYESVSDLPHRIPLAIGGAIEVLSTGTSDTSWARALESVWRWVSKQNLAFQAEEESRGEGMVLASSSIRAAHRSVVDAARNGAQTLLITGPTGAGKERLANAFHRHAGRPGPFVAVNCSMFNKELLRSELFGAEVGSYTSATRRIIGAVERAQGGTLFLDEVGELGSEVQPMLLRFLDQREYERVGNYGRPQRADVRVVAATNRDLRALVRAGTFRSDLWYRLSVHVVEVPALNQRWADVESYLRSTSLKNGSTLRDALTAEAKSLLSTHSWDGNFRELANFAERLTRTAGAAQIDEGTCRRLLEEGALNAVTASSPAETTEPTGEDDWAALASRATRAFVEDRGTPPRTWDDQKECYEKYLKPLLFFNLSGAGKFGLPASEDALVSLAARVAGPLQADRGTALKQLSRYFERFARR